MVHAAVQDGKKLTKMSILQFLKNDLIVIQRNHTPLRMTDIFICKPF